MTVTGLLELDLLQQTLNEALDCLRNEMTKLGLPELSSSATEQHPMDKPDFILSPRLFEARRVALASLGEIRNLIQYPYQKALEQASGIWDTACLNIFVLAGIVDRLAEPSVRSRGLHVQTLARLTDMDPAKLSVILRCLTVDGWIRESEEGHFVLCRPSLELMQGARKWLNYPIRAELAKELINQVTMDGWKHAQTPDKSAFQLALKTELPIWAWMDGHPDIRAKHQLAIQSIGDAYNYPVMVDIPWSRYDGWLFVDVAGGIGNLTLSLSQILPNSRFVIQDVPEVIEYARENVTRKAPELLDQDRLQLEVFDLFEPRPPSDKSAVYVLRYILHDWSDENCVKILQIIAASMTVTSRIFLLEHIVQVRDPPEVKTQTVHSADFDDVDTYRAAAAPVHLPANFGAAGKASAALNITMLATLNARERTLREWTSIVASASLSVVGVYYTRGLIAGIECALATAQ